MDEPEKCESKFERDWQSMRCNLLVKFDVFILMFGECNLVFCCELFQFLSLAQSVRREIKEKCERKVCRQLKINNTQFVIIIESIQQSLNTDVRCEEFSNL